MAVCRTRCGGLDRRRIRGLNGYDPESRVRAAYAPAEGDPVAGMISADVAVVLPEDYLVKVDRASMASGLEVRPPLLDHELLELTARMPSSYKVSHGETKRLLKECYRGDLPPALLRRAKQGFEMPVERCGRPASAVLVAVLNPRAPVAVWSLIFISRRCSPTRPRAAARQVLGIPRAPRNGPTLSGASRPAHRRR